MHIRAVVDAGHLSVRTTSISLVVQPLHTSRETPTSASSNPGLTKSWRTVCLLVPWLCLSSLAGSTASPYCYDFRIVMAQALITRVQHSQDPRPDIVSLARASSLGRHRLPPLCSLTTIARPARCATTEHIRSHRPGHPCPFDPSWHVQKRIPEEDFGTAGRQRSHRGSSDWPHVGGA